MDLRRAGESSGAGVRQYPRRTVQSCPTTPLPGDPPDHPSPIQRSEEPEKSLLEVGRIPAPASPPASARAPGPGDQGDASPRSDPWGIVLGARGPLQDAGDCGQGFLSLTKKDSDPLLGLLHGAPRGVRQNRFRWLVCYLGQRSDTDQDEGHVVVHRDLLVMVEGGRRVTCTRQYLPPWRLPIGPGC